MSLTEARLNGLAADLNRVRQDVAAIRDIVRTCMIGVRIPAIHERELLRMTRELHPHVGMLRLRLGAIAGDIPQLSRRAHRGASSSAHGHLGNIRGTLPIVERELEQCARELRAVSGEIADIFNSPTRTASEFTGAPFELLDLALELVTAALIKWRQV
jgi:hypothetical protein